MKPKIVIVLICIAVLFSGMIGYFIHPTTVDKSSFEARLKYQIKEKANLHLQALVADQKASDIEKKRKNDSLSYVNKIKILEIHNQKLIKIINEISLKNASAHDLDSIRIALYGDRR